MTDLGEGSVVRLSKFTYVIETPKVRISHRFNLVKKRQIVAVLLGVVDEGSEIDPVAMLMRLGWTPPASPIAKALVEHTDHPSEPSHA